MRLTFNKREECGVISITQKKDCRHVGEYKRNL